MPQDHDTITFELSGLTHFSKIVGEKWVSRSLVSLESVSNFVADQRARAQRTGVEFYCTCSCLFKNKLVRPAVGIDDPRGISTVQMSRSLLLLSRPSPRR